MDLSTIIIIVVAIIALIILLKILAKNIVKLLAVLAIILGLGVYLFFIWGNSQKDVKFQDIITNYSIKDLKLLYCSDRANKISKIKCECIITPIISDLESRFTKSELEKLQKNRIKFGYELLKSIKNKKSEINKRLKEKDALYLFREFKTDIVSAGL